MPSDILLPLATLAVAAGLAVGVALFALDRRSARGPRPTVRRHALQRPDPVAPVAPRGPVRLAPRRIEVAGPRPADVPRERPSPAEPVAAAVRWDDPRQRLWRDTAAVLLVGCLSVLAVSALAGIAGPRGAVLAATGTPAPSPDATPFSGVRPSP